MNEDLIKEIVALEKELKKIKLDTETLKNGAREQQKINRRFNITNYLCSAAIIVQIISILLLTIRTL